MVKIAMIRHVKKKIIKINSILNWVHYQILLSPGIIRMFFCPPEMTAWRWYTVGPLILKLSGSNNLNFHKEGGAGKVGLHAMSHSLKIDVQQRNSFQSVILSVWTERKLECTIVLKDLLLIFFSHLLIVITII